MCQLLMTRRLHAVIVEDVSPTETSVLIEDPAIPDDAPVPAQAAEEFPTSVEGLPLKIRQLLKQAIAAATALDSPQPL
jgi:hypothetical protein